MGQERYHCDIIAVQWLHNWKYTSVVFYFNGVFTKNKWLQIWFVKCCPILTRYCYPWQNWYPNSEPQGEHQEYLSLAGSGWHSGIMLALQVSGLGLIPSHLEMTLRIIVHKWQKSAGNHESTPTFKPKDRVIQSPKQRVPVTPQNRS